MRIVHLINGLGTGGGERLVADLATGLREHDTVVYCLTRAGAIADELRQRGATVRRLSWEGIPNPVGWLRFVHDLTRADVLHTHFFYSDLVGGVLGRILRVRRRLSTRHELGAWMRRRHRWLEPWVYRGFDEILCVSNAVRDSLLDRGVGEVGLTVVRSGIELPAGERVQKQRVVISVGRLERVKGHDILLKAFAAADLGDWRLVLVGDGSERRRLERLAEELGVAGRCEFVGEHSPPEVRELLAAASLFVLPSRTEALGLALLEGMAAGCACIASRVGGIPEVVRHQEDGWLVEAGDVEAMAAALARLAADETLARRLAAAGRERVAVEFSLDRFVARVGEIYGRSAC